MVHRYWRQVCPFDFSAHLHNCFDCFDIRRRKAESTPCHNRQNPSPTRSASSVILPPRPPYHPREAIRYIDFRASALSRDSLGLLACHQSTQHILRHDAEPLLVMLPAEVAYIRRTQGYRAFASLEDSASPIKCCTVSAKRLAHSASPFENAEGRGEYSTGRG